MSGADRADGERIAFDGHCRAELVIADGVREDQFCLLHPGRAAANENVHCADAGIVRSADDDRVCVNGDGKSELAGGGRVVGQQFRLLTPDPAAARENVSCA